MAKKAAAPKGNVPKSAIKPEAIVEAEGKNGRTTWTGALVSGMISIPVALYAAARGETVSFNMIHAQCKSKVKQAGYYCPCCVEVEVLKTFTHTIPTEKPDDKPQNVEYVAGTRAIMSADDANVYAMKKQVAVTENLAMLDKEQIVKGYEYKDGAFVVLTPEEIKAQKPESGSNIEISGFVDADSINPLYFESSYYLAPDKEISNKSYSVLRQGMIENNVAAVGKVCIRQSENVIFILPHQDGGMVAYTAFLCDEIRQIHFMPAKPVTPAELAAVSNYITALKQPLDMSIYKDEYRARLYALIEAKQKGETVTIPEAPKAKPVQSENVIEMFQASAVAAKMRREKKSA